MRPETKRCQVRKKNMHQLSQITSFRRRNLTLVRSGGKLTNPALIGIGWDCDTGSKSYCLTIYARSTTIIRVMKNLPGLYEDSVPRTRINRRFGSVSLPEMPSVTEVEERVIRDRDIATRLKDVFTPSSTVSIASHLL